MSNSGSSLDATELGRRALSRWDNESGATESAMDEVYADMPEVTNTELIHLRVRIIALENMMIVVLAQGTD